MATIVAAAGGGNWTTGGTWVGGVAPTAADDVQLDGTAGNVTITSGAVCRSLDCTGYTGTLTHTAAVTLTIGDATAGAGNIALKLVAGMTYTLGSSTTSALSFVSTSATTQTISWGGKIPGNVTFNGAGGKWQVQDSWIASPAVVTLTTGSLDLNSQTITWNDFQSDNSNTRSITGGTALVTITSAVGQWNTLTTTGLTQSMASSTLTFTGAGGYLRSGGTYGTVNFTGAGNLIQTQGFTCATLNITGSAIKNAGWSLPASVTVTGTLTVNGNSAANRFQIFSSVIGSARVITAGAVVASYVDFQDITGAGAANWNLSAITGGAGDCGGNVGITFTTPATQTWSGTSGGNWSANAWTTRMPLPQDDVVINNAFTAGQTVSIDVPRIGKNIDFTGVSAVTLSNGGSFTTNSYGSFTLTSNVTVSFSGAHIFAGRGTYTITSAGRTFTPNMSVGGPGGTYTLQDAFSVTNSLQVLGGTLNTNNQTITCATTTITGSFAIGNFTASTVNLTSTAAVNLISRGAAATLTTNGATFNIVNASANTRTINVGGNGNAITNATINYTIAGSTGTLVFGGSGTGIGTINFSDASNARTLQFASGQTFSISVFNVQGTAGKLMTINSTTGGTQATISKTSGYVSCDYLSIQDSAATGGASWYAGVNSTNVSNNTGWFFQAYSPSKFLELM